jgi:hypothetical protein
MKDTFKGALLRPLIEHKGSGATKEATGRVTARGSVKNGQQAIRCFRSRVSRRSGSEKAEDA